MEKQRDIPGMLDLIPVPGFCVEAHRVTRVNSGARNLSVTEGMSIEELLCNEIEIYDCYQGGSLYLGLRLPGCVRGASVNRIGSTDVFLLEADAEYGELTALALAARELREPLNSIIHAAKSLRENDEETAKLNRSLHQMLRILGNMADASAYSQHSHQETVNICAVIGEIFEKAEDLFSKAGVTLCYRGPEEPIFSLADSAQLERAILNMLSNALKFSAPGGTVTATLTRQGRYLKLRILDNGCGIADELLPTVFSRYLREPAIEEGRQGLGLGMVLIRSAAIHHGGTVLIERPEAGGTGITLTLQIRQNSTGMLRSPALQVDYSGGLDHALLELSDSLPPELY